MAEPALTIRTFSFPLVERLRSCSEKPCPNRLTQEVVIPNPHPSGEEIIVACCDNLACLHWAKALARDLYEQHRRLWQP